MKQVLLYITAIAFILSASFVYAKGQVYNFKTMTTASQKVDQTKHITGMKNQSCNECCKFMK